MNCDLCNEPFDCKKGEPFRHADTPARRAFVRTIAGGRWRGELLCADCHLKESLLRGADATVTVTRWERASGRSGMKVEAVRLGAA